MKEFEFERLSLDKKCRYVLSRCVFLASRHTLTDNQRTCRINLYHDGHVFFEIWYNSEYDYIGDVKICTERNIMDAYVDQIDLEKITSL